MDVNYIPRKENALVTHVLITQAHNVSYVLLEKHIVRFRHNFRDIPGMGPIHFVKTINP